ncbi:MAG: hypothetical protein ABI581_11780 [Sediminibacterium sp.]
MSIGPQYTSCVEKSDFKPINKALVITLLVLIGVGGIFGFLSAGLGVLISLAIIVQLLRYVLDFMLNGKLICLHRNSASGCQCCSSDSTTVCAIGEVLDAEQVGEDKNFYEDVDNDYAINLILAPFDIKSFKGERPADDGRGANEAIATNPTLQSQGDLITDQKVYKWWTGYFRTIALQLSNGSYHAWTSRPNRDEKYGDLPSAGEEKIHIPVLHCEFEGSRIRDMLNVIDAFSFGSSWCKKNFFTKFLCKVLQSVFAPLILIALAVAWKAATDGNIEDSLEGGGIINNGQWVIVRGRWVYDGGHVDIGYNEIHATRRVQRVDNIRKDPAGFKEDSKIWCSLLDEVPCVELGGPATLSTSAQLTYDNQQKPENLWTFHPDVDGCIPCGEEDRPSIE